MSSSNYIYLTIIGCGIATWLSRVLPFFLLKKFSLPKVVIEFLSFVPIVIMSTMWFGNLFIAQPGQLSKVRVDFLIASLPTVVAAIISKSLLVIVIVGIISLTVLRLI
ncbi:AzlD domain-containing protein [Lactobacillus sp. IBH004]|uniref:AzlD domain-containing protein n=1 Tax=Lactobacillus sp. IBH004 TaxID=2879107 RepID=UPI002243BED4|nr:AzlD domain-containing protein [Lactobacillus sp. IBH004]UZN41321.1 AzlD domain-containing protein [Lactobacillus sp. IBH004]